MSATSLRDFPLKFDTTQLFKPESVNVKPAKLSNVNESEAGTDLVNLRRARKFQASFKFNCTDTWENFFAGYHEKGSFDFSYYDAGTSAYKTIVVRMENYSADWEPHSDYITVSMGLYVVTFDLIEL
jgi:hypothetical protein